MSGETTLGRASAAAALVALAVVAFLPAFEAGFVWDDDDNLTENAALRSPTGLVTIWTEPANVPPWYPAAHSALWLEYRLWGASPAGYHAVNVLLHALNALLAWTVLRRLGVRGAWLAAALFAVHPLQVESVAWITEQKNVLSMTFALATTVAWLRFRPALVDPADDRFDWRAWGVATLLFVLALLTKTVTASLPVVLLVLTWWKLGRVDRRDALATAPLIVVALALGGFTAWLERHAVGATGAAWDHSLFERVTIAGRAFWFYVAKVVWPWPVTYVYPRFRLEPLPLWGYAAPLAALVLVATLWRFRMRLGRGPLAAVLCFGLITAPALGFFDIYYMRYTFVADRWAYHATIALIALLVAGVSAAAGHLAVPPALRRAAAGLLVAAFAVTTWTYASAFRDEETLWRDTLGKNPDSVVAHNNLGNILLARDELDAATRHFEQAVALDANWPEAHNNLGTARFAAGDVAAAAHAHERALELDPDFADAHNNLGIALATTGRMDEALEHFHRSVELQPTLASARYNLGIALQYRHADATALEQLTAAARLEPNDPATLASLGLALARNDRYADAAARYRTALELRPNDPTTVARLAWLLATCEDASVRDGRAAAGLADTLVRAAPGEAPQLQILAAALAESGRYPEAVTAAERAMSHARGTATQELAGQLDGYRAGRPYRTPAGCPRCWR